MNYRPDIDGLRAIAVSTVVLFHAGASIFSGGYIGVDVFFVISGYLITGIINNEIVSGKFSLANFFERRIRRIFPALFFMIAVTSLFASIFMMPKDLMDFSKSLVATVFSGSNMLFWWQSGYFDGAAEAKPLLHTWSLAVEEQFYLVFPISLAMAYRFFPKRIMIVLVSAIVLTFVLSVVFMKISPISSFYLAPLRAWELLIGSMIALAKPPEFKKQIYRDALSVAGLAAIIVPAILYTKLTPFPAQGALLPVLGSAAIIFAGVNGTSLVGRMLALRPVVFVGLLSYSFYLWHWPALVIYEYVLIDELTPLQSAMAVTFAFFMAYVSWKFVERPFRSKTGVFNRQSKVFGAAFATVFVAAALGGGLLLAEGMPSRFSPETRKILAASSSFTDRMSKCSGRTELQLDPKGGCVIGESPTPTGFLIGDSHADAMTGAVQAISKDTGMSFYYGVDASCPPLLGVGTDAACIDNNRKRLDFIARHPEITTVVVVSRWTSYTHGRAVDFGPAESNEQLPSLVLQTGEILPRFSKEASGHFQDGLTAMVKRLVAMKKNVIVVYPIPETGYNIPTTLARMVDQGRRPEDFTRPADYYRSRHRDTFAMLDGLPYGAHLKAFHPEKDICKGKRCMVYARGEVLYWDDDHLSIEGAKFLARSLEKTLLSFRQDLPG